MLLFKTFNTFNTQNKIIFNNYRYSHRLDFTSNNNIVTESLNEWSWDAVNERILHYEAQASPAFLLLMFELVFKTVNTLFYILNTYSISLIFKKK